MLSGEEKLELFRSIHRIETKRRGKFNQEKLLQYLFDKHPNWYSASELHKLVNYRKGGTHAVLYKLFMAERLERYKKDGIFNYRLSPREYARREK